MSYQKDFAHQDARLRVSAKALGGGRYQVQVGAESFTVEAWPLADGRIGFRLGDRCFEACAARFGKNDLQVRLDNQSYQLRAYQGSGRSGGGQAATGVVEAPMTGTLLKLSVELGQEVQASDTVAVVSAMKMEHKLHAGVDGKVVEIAAAEGDTIDQGQLILRVE